MAYKYKYTQYLNGLHSGASESWMFDLNPAPLRDLLASLVPLLQKRGAMLASNWRTHSHDIVVIQDDAGVPVQREGLPEYRYIQAANAPAALPEDIDIKYRVYGSGADVNKYRFVNFAGGHKVALSSDDAFANNPTWITLASAFFAKLLDYNPGWFVRTRSAPVNVVGYTMNSTGQVVVELDAALPGADAGGGPFRVRISGVNGQSEINGEWTAYQYQFPGAGGVVASFQLKPRVGLWAYQSPGQVVTYDRSWVPFGTELIEGTEYPLVDVWGGGKRQHGPPFGVSRGRDPARQRG